MCRYLPVPEYRKPDRYNKDRLMFMNIQAIN
jgi:hypothetical protein